MSGDNLMLSSVSIVLFSLALRSQRPPSFTKAIHERLPVGKTFLLFLFFAVFRPFCGLIEPPGGSRRVDRLRRRLRFLSDTVFFFFFFFSRSCTGGGLVGPTYSFVNNCLPCLTTQRRLHDLVRCGRPNYAET